MLIWLIVIIVTSIMFFCTLGSTSLNAIPLERLWRLREGAGRTARAVEYWITHSQQITWSLRVTSRISCVTLALILITLIEGRPLPFYAFIIALVIATFLVAFPGSLIPSAWAQLAGEKIALTMLPVIRVFGIIFSPILMACLFMVNLVLRLFGRDSISFKPLYLRSELDQCMGGFERTGKLADHEKRMIRHLFAFGDIRVSEIMTPRVAMQCLAEGETVARAIEMARAEHLSRIPVYRGRPDSVVGVLYAKDLLERWGQPGVDMAHVGGLAREPLFVPQTAKARTLFFEMLKKQMHIAIVVDEYGAAIGLVTMEDILEEIVGEIRDEYDSAEGPLCERVAEGLYHVDARLSVNDAREEIGVDIPDKEEYDTVGGFVCATLGRIPSAGEIVECGRCSIKVIEATVRGVGKLEIRVKRAAPAGT